MSDPISRRAALMTAGLAGLAATAAACDEADDAKQYTPALEMPRPLAAEVVAPDRLASRLTDDKLLATVQFGQDLDALTIDLQGAQGHSAAKVATFEVPFSPPPTADDESKKLFGFLAIVRGDILKDKDTRVVATIDFGGQSFAVESPYGEERDGDINERCFAFPASDFTVTTTQQTVQVDGKDVTQDVRTPHYVPAPPHLTAVLTVSAQRRKAEGLARISIREMDIGIVQPLPPPQGGDPPAKSIYGKAAPASRK